MTLSRSSCLRFFAKLYGGITGRTPMAASKAVEAPVLSDPPVGHTARPYRADIDGLRAIAVAIVVLYHFHFSFLPGGFVGVDVFFVISGYLISSIIIEELNDGSFSLIRFYERRARRILPALCAMCLATVIVASTFFFPGDLIDLGKSLAAAALFVSNIYFWSVSGYFMPAMKEQPLLHTWSLGVEEQFYLFYPLILAVAHKIGKGHGKADIITFMAIASFAASAGTIYEWGEANFYLIPFRFWELALGGILCLIPAFSLKKSLLSDALVLAGIGAIVQSAHTYSFLTHFPGPKALLPCMGAAMIIFAGQQSKFGAWILRVRPVSFIGQISYSLYLWHWPVQAFIQYRFSDVFERPENWLWRWGALALSLILATVSWRYIEQPFRNRTPYSRRNIFSYALAATLCGVLIAGAIVAARGFPARLPQRAVAIAAASRDKDIPPFNSCAKIDDPARKDPDCLVGDASAPAIHAVLWGDSHMSAMAPALAPLLKEKHIKAIQLVYPGCPPFIGDFSETDFPYKNCRRGNGQALAYIRKHPEIKYIILHAHWASHVIDLEVPGAMTPEDRFYQAMAATVDKLKSMGKTVLIIGSVPQVAFDVPHCLSRQMAYGPRYFACLPTTLGKHLDDQKVPDAAFKKLAGEATIYQPGAFLCAYGQCPLMINGDPMYFDSEHISRKGAAYLRGDVARAFGPILSSN